MDAHVFNNPNAWGKCNDCGEDLLAVQHSDCMVCGEHFRQNAEAPLELAEVVNDKGVHGLAHFECYLAFRDTYVLA